MSDYEYYQCPCGRNHPVGVQCAIGRKRVAHSSAPSGSVPHVGLWIQTKSGNVAHILADPKMSEETLKALEAMIDAAAKAAAEGTLFKEPNAPGELPGAEQK